MLTENKFSKYLIYAIGEIILVVIGILIALAINNWNEESKIEKSINSHLTILKQNLLEDQVQLKELKQYMTENIHYSDSTMLQIRTNIPVNNKIKKYLVKLVLEYKFSPNTNAIETITQSNEIPSLKPDLQTAVLNYYALIERTKEREHISNTQIQTKYENHLNNLYPEVFQKDNEWEFIKTFYKNDPRTILPINEKKLLNDKKLEPLLVSRYFQSVALQGFYEELIESSDIILKLLEQN
jgi:hypothetical protein